MEKAEYVMKEIHEGICKNHSRLRSIVHKLVRAGYYWPHLQQMPEVQQYC